MPNVADCGHFFVFAEFCRHNRSSCTGLNRVLGGAGNAIRYLAFSIPLGVRLSFSYSFLPGTVNCLKWTLFAAGIALLNGSAPLGGNSSPC
jgi:hypothetical protein